ncbi:hypothetical protein, partial [Streptomyces californicus]
MPGKSGHAHVLIALYHARGCARPCASDVRPGTRRTRGEGGGNPVSGQFVGVVGDDDALVEEAAGERAVLV